VHKIITLFPFRIFLPISSMSEYFHPNIPHPELPYWRPPPWLKYQAFKFLVENPSTTCVPDCVSSNASVPIISELTNPTEPIEEALSGNTRKRKYCNEGVFHPISHQYCHSCDPLQKVIKIEDPIGNFW